MKYSKFILFIFICLSTAYVNAQKKGSNFELKNALIVGQFDKSEDRYSVEASITTLFNAYGIKSIPSSNIIKIGEDAANLAIDSVQQKVAGMGYDTYVIVTVRGYDRTFKNSTVKMDVKTALERGSLYSVYQPEIVSVSFEFRVYRNGEFVGVDTVKIGGVGDRENVFKKLSKAIEKRIEKYWI